jgi:hypothetical protein
MIYPAMALSKKMRELMIYRKEYRSETFFHKENVHAGYCAPDFETLDEAATEKFGVTWRFGILCEDRTWFNGVHLLNPAEVLTYDIESGSIETEKY